MSPGELIVLRHEVRVWRQPEIADTGKREHLDAGEPIIVIEQHSRLMQGFRWFMFLSSNGLVWLPFGKGESL